MAVTETLALPNQPTQGRVHRVSLGGDGYTAPHAAYVVDNMILTGDVSGGALSHIITMDERFCSLVAYVNILSSQVASADADWVVGLDSNIANGAIAPQLEGRVIAATSATVSSVTLASIFTPVPVVLPGAGAGAQINSNVLNVENDGVRISALIYLFNVRVREVTPMGPLLWARGAT